MPGEISSPGSGGYSTCSTGQPTWLSRRLRRSLAAPCAKSGGACGVLEDAGFPIYDEPGTDGRRSLWKIREDFKLRLPLKLWLSELAALIMSRDLLGPAAALGPTIRSAFDKISRVLSKDALALIDRMRGPVHGHHAPSSSNESSKNPISCRFARRGLECQCLRLSTSRYQSAGSARVAIQNRTGSLDS